MTNTTRPPRRPSEESTKVWRSVLADYKLEQRHEAVLLAALEALDRLRQAHAGRAGDSLHRQRTPMGLQRAPRFPSPPTTRGGRR